MEVKEILGESGIAAPKSEIKVLEAENKSAVIVLDEFQEIARLPEGKKIFSTLPALLHF